MAMPVSSTIAATTVPSFTPQSSFTPPVPLLSEYKCTYSALLHRGQLSSVLLVHDSLSDAPKILKVFTSKWVITATERISLASEYFASEKRAYQALISSSVLQRPPHNSGPAPFCFGWAEIKRETILKVPEEEIKWLFDDNSIFSEFLEALVIEYIYPSKQITWQQGMDREFVERCVRELAKIHTAGVMHGDVIPRNCLVTCVGEKEKIWWIDFDRAYPMNASNQYAAELEMKLEKYAVGNQFVAEACGNPEYVKQGIVRRFSWIDGLHHIK